jgi:AraC-like ligand binding domain
MQNSLPRLPAPRRRLDPCPAHARDGMPASVPNLSTCAALPGSTGSHTTDNGSHYCRHCEAWTDYYYILPIKAEADMPILNEIGSDNGWTDPDAVPRPVVTYGFITEAFGSFELAPHHHAKGQIILAQRGALSCEVDGGLWIVPPRSAIWIPGGALHSVKATGALEGYNAFIAPDVAAGLPASCCALSVSPLLRELLARAAVLPVLYEETGPNARLVAVLLDEIAAAGIEDLHLPMPADARLRRVVDLMMAAPAERGTLDG